MYFIYEQAISHSLWLQQAPVFVDDVSFPSLFTN